MTSEHLVASQVEHARLQALRTEETDSHASSRDALSQFGWTTAVSQRTGETYYLNEATGESTYDFPLDAVGQVVPAGWTTAVSRTTGQTYYINEATGESTYELPQATHDESSQSTIFDEGVPPDERE